MTYNDVYKKFMIEYDKADISSSYPSLTIYEIATLLDKAYLALITQKVTGNNPRQSVLDSDIKASSDIQGLITTVKGIDFVKGLYENELECDLRKDYLYLIRCYVKRIGKTNYDQIA